jgi:hypothetical protein
MPLWLKIALAGIVLYGLWLRLDTYAERTWWGDELCQYDNTLGPLKPFWTRASYTEVHSFPGDYLLTYPFVQVFKTNKWGVAIPHLLATLLGFYVLFLLCRRHLTHPVSWLITFVIFSLNRELIFHALELRPYTVLATMGLAAFYFMDDLFNPAIQISARGHVLYFILIMLYVIYHPYGLVILVFGGLFFFLRYCCIPGFWGKIKKNWVFWTLSSGLGIALWIYYSNSPYTIDSGKRIVFEYIHNPLKDPKQFFKAIVGNLAGHKFSYLLLIGIAARFFYPIKEIPKFLFVLFFAIVLPLFVLMMSDVIHRYWFIQRQFIWVSAIFALFVGWCWDGILPHKWTSAGGNWTQRRD